IIRWWRRTTRSSGATWPRKSASAPVERKLRASSLYFRWLYSIIRINLAPPKRFSTGRWLSEDLHDDNSPGTALHREGLADDRAAPRYCARSVGIAGSPGCGTCLQTGSGVG